MKNSRIFALALCGICLLGGCGSRNGEEREKEEAVMAAAENAQEDLHETDAVDGEDILSSSDQWQEIIQPAAQLAAPTTA